MRALPILFVSCLLTFAVLASSSCTLITQVDRSKIGEGGAAGASGEDAGSGGTSAD